MNIFWFFVILAVFNYVFFKWGPIGAKPPRGTGGAPIVVSDGWGGECVISQEEYIEQQK